MELEQLMDSVGRVRAEGASIRDFRFYGSEVERLALGIKDREAGNPHAPLSLSQTMGVRFLLIWSDGRISRGYLERRQVEDEPVEALTASRAASYDDPDAAQVLGPADMPAVALHDPVVAAAAGGNTGLLARRLATVRRRVAEAGVGTWSGSFSFARGQDRLVTSAGLDVGGAGTSAGWHVTADGEIGDGFAARAVESEEDFEARLDRLLAMARELRSTAPPMSAGVHRVILHPRVVESYALETLLANLEGSSVAHGDGHFSREQFGSARPVLREDLTLRLDPLQPLKSGSYRFTREGVPAAACTFLECGRLVQPILDLKYARRLGLAPTSLPYASDTLFLEGPPLVELPRALEMANGGALVLSVLGVHTQDSASGDFSLSAPQVLRIENGAFRGKLKATLVGNLFDLLSSASLELVRFAGEHTPALLVDCRLDPE